MAELNTNTSNLASSPTLVEQTVPAETTAIANKTDNDQATMRELTDNLAAQNQTARDLSQKALEPQKPSQATTAESRLTSFSRASISIAELAASLPLIFASLIGQAENIVDHEENDAGSFLLNYVTTTIKTLSSIFRFGFRKLVPRQEDEDNVTINKRPFILDDMHSRISQTAFVRQVTAFIFSMRRSLFEFFPNLLTVPAEEHDPNKPRNSPASGFKKNIFSLVNVVLSPFRFSSSLLSTLISLPANAIGTFAAYNGDQKAFNFAKFGSEISDILLPLVSNLSSLNRITKAYINSWTNKTSKSVEFDKYNLGLTNIVQAVFGSVTTIPHFFSSLFKLKEKVLELHKGESKLAILARDFVNSSTLFLKSLGIYSGNTAALQQGAYVFVSKGLHYLMEYTNRYLNKLMNSNDIFKSFFTKFMPTDLQGNIILGNSENQLNNNIRDGYVFNRFKKSNFFNELYDYTHPIQSALMLLPNAFVDLHDPYIQDNGTKILRWIDRLVGVNSLVLSLPNAVIYFAKTRAPQLILKYFETKQRNKDIEGIPYSSYQGYINLINQLKASSMPGTGYIAATLDKLDIRADDFRNSSAIRSKLDILEKDAKEQEHSVKASELVTAMRIGLRHLIMTQNKAFYARRDENGYTAEEQGKLRIYDSIGKFGATIRGIPVVGWFASPLIDLFRRMYKVEEKQNRKLFSPKTTTNQISTATAA